MRMWCSFSFWRLTLAVQENLGVKDYIHIFIKQIHHYEREQKVKLPHSYVSLLSVIIDE